MPYTYDINVGGSSIGVVPTGALKVSTKANFVNNNGWSIVTFQIPSSALSSNYSRLWIRQSNNSNTGDLALMIDSFCIRQKAISGIDDKLGMTEINSMLYQNYPNPFHTETSIRYCFSNKYEKASIVLFDITGRVVNTYPIYNLGNGIVTIQNSELQAGSYIYTLIVDGKAIQSKRMMIASC